jgi:hypothetical protein
MKHIRFIWLGMLNNGAGASIALVLLVAGFVMRGWLGLAVMACLFGSLFLFGAYESGKIIAKGLVKHPEDWC